MTSDSKELTDSEATDKAVETFSTIGIASVVERASLASTRDGELGDSEITVVAVSSEDDGVV